MAGSSLFGSSLDSIKSDLEPIARPSKTMYFSTSGTQFHIYKYLSLLIKKKYNHHK